MKPSAALLAALALVAQGGPALGQTLVVGDAWITGQVAVGTTTPSARLTIQASSAASTVFQVSGVDETPFLAVASSGAVGAGVVPAARLDVNGSGDSGVTALELRDGNLYPMTSGYQMSFGYNGSSNLRHAIRTEHSTDTANNGIDFLLWTPSVGTTTVGNLGVLSLVTTSTSASVHVMPIGTPQFEMVISNGVTTGAGTLHRASEASVSSRELKSEISYLGLEEELKAYQEVAGLKHARFRYKVLRKGRLERDRHQPMRRGLIYEDAPESIKGRGRSLVVDERVNNAELAMKELMRRLEAAQAEAARLEAGATP